MPEGVEVCLTAQFLHYLLKGRKITTLQVTGGRYSRHELSGLKDFRSNLPLKVNSVNSKGKFLWFELENDYYILNTFGLEGGWGVQKKKHSGIHVTINKNNADSIFDLYFSDPRNFGTLKIVKGDNGKKELEKKLDSLGSDFLQTSFTDDEFYDRVRMVIKNKNKRNKEIIKILMDQRNNHGLGSGLGNYLVVEILYHAKISPYRKLIEFYENKDLSDKLSQAIKYVVSLSYKTSKIGYLARMDKIMKKWINKNRRKYNFHNSVKLNEVFKFKVYKQKTDPSGYKVKADKIISGRTTYWVPELQL